MNPTGMTDYHFSVDSNYKPPTFRQPLTTKIKWRLEQSITETFTNIIELNNEALKQPEEVQHCTQQHFDPWPLIQLQILFEQLVLFPIPQNPFHKTLPTKNSKLHHPHQIT
jgi:hypothetical protein